MRSEHAIVLLTLIGAMAVACIYDTSRAASPVHRGYPEGFADKKAVLILYHASWCPHCRDFMPTWQELKGDLDRLGVAMEDYEATTDEGKLAASAAGVKGYPTIHLRVGDTVVPLPGGMRAKKEILEFVKSKTK
jgi:thiol-disulfide isomerase/thioredoxin